MALAFISAFLLVYCGVFVCLLLGVALPHRPGAELQASGLFLQFMCAPLHVCSGRGVFSFLEFFSVFFFSLPPLPLFHFVYYYASLCFAFFFFSTELLALCDGCLGWGWVWRAGLVAGLRVGQAFGMFLLPGFGVAALAPGFLGTQPPCATQALTSL